MNEFQKEYGQNAQKKAQLEFVDSKVALSKDNRQIIHILQDGRACGKSVNYYRTILSNLDKKLQEATSKEK